MLPNEKTPEIAIYRKRSKWIMVKLSSDGTVTLLLQKQDSIHVGRQQWRVHLINHQAATPPKNVTINE